jgi:hypothetical protein
MGNVVHGWKSGIAGLRRTIYQVKELGRVAETSGSAGSPSQCAGAAHRVDILVFVRGSVRPLGPRGAKVGGGIWASWVCRAGEVEGKDPRCLAARRRDGEWV